MRCTTCGNPNREAIDALLRSGSSTRRVAQLYSVPRTTLARHRQHIAPASRPFAVIPGQDGPPGPGDPLAEAFALAERARTPREKLRALEAVRGATKLRLRGRDVDPEDRELLDLNVQQAELAYRDSADFETQARALSGWRESLFQRLDAVEAPEGIETAFVMTFVGADGEQVRGEPGKPFRMAAADFWRGVPKKYRDPERFRVDRTIHLAWPPDTGGTQDVRVYDGAGLVWRSEIRAKDSPRQEKEGGKER